MNATTVTQLETRLHRVEWQNRILITLLCATAGLALLGATKGGPNILNVDEIRTHRISLTGNDGRVVHSWAVAGGWVIEK